MMASKLPTIGQIIFCILFLMVGFFTGLFIAKFLEVGKGQGLAAGAMVLSYGVVGGLLGLIISIFLSGKLPKLWRIRMSIVLFLMLCCMVLYVYFFLVGR